jgi:hypothetical protein
MTLAQVETEEVADAVLDWSQLSKLSAIDVARSAGVVPAKPGDLVDLLPGVVADKKDARELWDRCLRHAVYCSAKNAVSHCVSNSEGRSDDTQTVDNGVFGGVSATRPDGHPEQAAAMHNNAGPPLAELLPSHGTLPPELTPAVWDCVLTTDRGGYKKSHHRAWLASPEAAARYAAALGRPLVNIRGATAEDGPALPVSADMVADTINVAADHDAHPAPCHAMTPALDTQPAVSVPVPPERAQSLAHGAPQPVLAPLGLPTAADTNAAVASPPTVSWRSYEDEADDVYYAALEARERAWRDSPHA